MAPSPEHDNEPKAPDKNDKSSENVELRTNSDFLDEHLSSPARELDLQDSSVSTLDDSQLKALLDEAITYKTPKDREGKSRMFKALLQEAEEDERNARAASASGPQLVRYYNTATAAAAAAARRTRTRASGASAASARTHGGSLQDLVQSELYEAAGVSGSHTITGSRKQTRRRHHHPVTGHRTVSVSARQREGGSLPSNVNAGVLYTDTVSSECPVVTITVKRKDEMVEACAVSPAAEPQDAVGQQRMDYTVVDLEPASTDTAPLLTPPQSPPTPSIPLPSDSVDSTADETRGLLQRDTRTTSYNSTETLPRFRYDSSGATATMTATLEAEGEKEEAAVEATSAGRKIGGGFDGVSRHQYFNPLEEALHHHRIPRIRYTSRATLEVDGISTVDKAITFPQFQHEANSPSGAASLQLDPDYSSVRCIVDSGNGDTASGTASGANSGRGAQTAKMVPTPYRLLSVASPKIIHGVERFQHHAEKKGLDENGNSVTTPTPSDSKKKKKCKVDRNVTVHISENLPGHRADIIADIDQLVKYIEEDDATSSKAKHHNKPSLNTTNHAKIQMESKKRTRVKTKSEATASNAPVVKKSNSLEEISKTKLEDLMSEDSKNLRRVKKQSTSEDGDRRSWGTEDSQQYFDQDLISSTVVNSETAEFHVVTKKKKSKKRSTPKLTQNQQSSYYQYHYQRIDASEMTSTVPATSPNVSASTHDRPEPQRRKSACSVPPSDKSADSSDVDSVHSLPVAPVHHRREEVSVGAPASTSYADIARTNGGQSTSSASSNCSSHSGVCIQPLVQQPQQQQNSQFWKVPTFSQSAAAILAAISPPGAPPPEPIPRLDATDFPCLGASPPKTDSKPSDCAPTPRTVYINAIKPNGPRRGCSSRPAVIILDDEQNGSAAPPSSDPIQVSGLTFGFELNEQLLNDSEGESPCATPPLRGASMAPAEVFTARFVAPQISGVLTETYNHDKIVTYVGLAWEDVVHQTNGKVQYYNGQ